MSGTLRVFLLLAVIAFLVVVVALLKGKKLSLRYTLLWLFFGLVQLLLVIFPGILGAVSRLFGIISEMNTLFVFLVGGLVILSLYLTSLASSQEEKIKRLLQDEALLEKRVRDLEALTEKTETVRGNETA